jgi:hypothetical protein
MLLDINDLWDSPDQREWLVALDRCRLTSADRTRPTLESASTSFDHRAFGVWTTWVHQVCWRCFLKSNSVPLTRAFLNP